MTFRKRNYRRLVKQKQEFDPLIRNFGRSNQSEIDPARKQLWQQANSFLFKQSYLDVWPLRPKIVKETRHHTHGRAVDRSEAKSYRLFSSACPELRFKTSGVGKQGSGLIQKNSSVAGEGDAARRAIDEPRRQLFFEKLDMPPKCRRQSFRVSAPHVRNAVLPPSPRNIVVVADPCGALPQRDYIIFLYKRTRIDAAAQRV